MHLRRRWGVAIRGVQSGRVSPLPWYKTYSKKKAERAVRRLRESSQSSITELLTEYHVYDYKEGAVA